MKLWKLSHIGDRMAQPIKIILVDQLAKQKIEECHPLIQHWEGMATAVAWTISFKCFCTIFPIEKIQKIGAE